MTVSRLETDLSLLLLHGERMEATDQADSSWRYPQYVKALHTQYEALKACPSAPSAEKMSEFRRRIDHLQSSLSPDPSEELVLVGSAPLPPAAASPVISVTGHGADVLAELRQRRAGRLQSEARAQLLRQPAATAAGATEAASSAEDDFEAVMKRHHQMQERAAEEMLALTRSLKQQSLVAKNVIAKDRETLESSTALTDKSSGRLQVESQRLSEFSARACRCWLWMLLAVVCATFMGMVLLIRLFGKKVRTVPPPSEETPQVEQGLLCGWLGWLLPHCGT